MEKLAFDIPLCGRRRELAILGEVLDQQNQQPSGSLRRRIVLIEGEPGCGKTALVKAIRDLVRTSGGYFLIGKCEESSVSNPFGSLSEALNDLVSQLLDDSDPLDWWNQMAENDGLSLSQMKSLIKMCPRLRELADGSQALSNQTNNQQQQSVADGDFRFSSTWSFEQFVVAVRSLFRTVARQKLVVLVQDDLQWARPDYWSAVKTVVQDAMNSGSESNNLLFIGLHRPIPDLVAVRDLATLAGSSSGGDRRSEDGRQLTTIRLGGLDVEAVAELVAAVTHRNASECMDLAQVLQAETHGNAMLLMQSLRHLKRKQLLFYSSESSMWEWNLEGIRQESVISEQFSGLSHNARTTLSIAASIGPSQFNAKTLNHLKLLHDGFDMHGDAGLHQDKLLEDVSTTLDQAVAEGLLESMGGDNYRFSHDRIREGAKALMERNSSSVSSFHVVIGRTLLQLASSKNSHSEDNDDEDDNLLMLAADHLNLGEAALTEGEERLELVHLNMQAADVAFRGMAQHPAKEYLLRATTLLHSIGGWDKHYDLALTLSTVQMRVLYCCGEMQLCQEVAKEAISSARSLTDSVPARQVQVYSLFHQGKPQQGRDHAWKALRELGFPLPSSRLGTRLCILKNMFRVRYLAASLTTEKLSNLPLVQNPNLISAMEFYWVLVEMAMLYGDMEIQLLATFSAMNNTLQYGHTPRTPEAIMSYAIILAKLGHLQSAEKFGQTAARMAEHSSAETRAVMLLGKGFFCSCWKQSVTQSLDMCVEAKSMLLETGNVSYLFLSCLAYTLTYTTSGLSLEPLARDVINMHSLLKELRLARYVDIFESAAQFILNLLGRSKDPVVFSGEIVANEKESLESYHRNGNNRAVASYNNFSLLISYIFNDLDRALPTSRRVRATTIEAASAMRPILCLFQGLTCFACDKRPKSWMSWSHVHEGKEYLAMLKRMMTQGCQNVAHMILLLEADLLSLRVGAAPEDVRSAYDGAIRSSARQGASHIQAIGNELAGEYFCRNGDMAWASTYLTRSCSLYQSWGARAKAGQLKVKYGALVADEAGHGGTSIKAVERFNDVSLATSTEIGVPPGSAEPF